MTTDTSRLDDHLFQFASIVDTAKDCESRGNLDAAAAYAQIAGRYAWLNHTGYFASPELESVLDRIGGQLHVPIGSPRHPANPRTVLHVVTQVYATSGPTQAIACWMEQDRDRRHVICITRQGPLLVPDKLAKQIDRSTDLVHLDRRPGGLVSRAARLRSLASGADIVLLHSHPYDVVPVISFSGQTSPPPVVYINHADHVFWVGTSVASLVLNMRDSGHLLSITRRGVDPARSVVMARPLRIAERVFSRDEAKRRIGVDPKQVLLVTAAGASKFVPIDKPSFFDLVLPVIERHRNTLLFAAGPSPSGVWEEMASRTGNRIRALGLLSDVSLLHQAADIYLDSYPFASLTSLIEAGSFGTPVVTFRGHPEDCAVLGSDTRGLDHHMIRPSDEHAFHSELDRLIRDSNRRHDYGARAMNTIISTHKGEGWLSSVSALYHTAAQLEPRPKQLAVRRGTGCLDSRVELIMADNPHNHGLSGAVRDNLSLLPVKERFKAWSTLSDSNGIPPFRQMTPEWIISRVGPLWKRVRAYNPVRK